jgi:hypothetical protein
MKLHKLQKKIVEIADIRTLVEVLTLKNRKFRKNTDLKESSPISK